MVAQPARKLLISDHDTIPLQLPRVELKHVPYAIAKRAIDVVASLVLLVLLSPLMLVVFVLVKLTSRGPALYKSERIGMGGRPFMFLKFRTMHADADERRIELMVKNEKDGPVFKIAKDPRVTSIGKFLRKTSIDELPQLIHVLTGQMTLVGPRPPIRHEVMQYDAAALERLSVKPGITCYWQICGRSDLSFEQWIEMDRQYLRDMSLRTDLSILVKTPIAVITCRGAY